MTTLRQAAQQALEALEFLQGGCTDSDDGTVDALTVWCPEVITALRSALEQPEPEPVAFYRPHKGFYWAKPTHISAPIVVDVPPVPLYTTPPAAQPEQKYEERIAPYSTTLSMLLNTAPPAAQRPWVELTEEELQFYRKKHSKLVNAGYDKPTDTNFFAKTFDSTSFYKEVSAALKERNT